VGLGSAVSSLSRGGNASSGLKAHLVAASFSSPPTFPIAQNASFPNGLDAPVYTCGIVMSAGGGVMGSPGRLAALAALRNEKLK